MRTSVLVLAVAALLLSATPARAEATLKLTSGTVQLGGAVGFTTLVDSAQGQTNTGFIFTLSPSAGYFVADNLELVAAIDLSIPFGDYYSNSFNFYFYPKRFAGELGARYHFALVSQVTGYAGLQVGFGYTWYENSMVRNSGDFTLTVPAGALVALNEHVALDVGLRLILSHNFEVDGWRFTVPLGYLGVQAFF